MVLARHPTSHSLWDTPKLCSAKQICYTALQMRVRLCLTGLVSVLLALAVYASTAFLQQPAAASSLGRTQPHGGSSLILSDLDGDDVIDSATLDRGDLRDTVELHLSRTDARVV